MKAFIRSVSSMTDRAVQRLAVLREQMAGIPVNMQETAAGPSVWQDVPQVFYVFRFDAIVCLRWARGG